MIAMNPKKWAELMEFSRRYDVEFAKIEGSEVPSELINALNEVDKQIGDIVLNGGLGEDWGEDTPENIAARHAVARIVIRMGQEFALAFGMTEGGEA